MHFICELWIRCVDGHEMIVQSDPDWQVHVSPIQKSGIYVGETYDARLEITEYVAGEWKPVIITPQPSSRLTERINPPLTIHERLKPEQLIRNEIGELILDFGQEITGWVEFRVNCEIGTEITLSFCEILQHNRFCSDTLRNALAECTYVSNGLETVWRPHFTFFGFRFVRVRGLPDLNPDDFTACAIYSDIEQTGWIETSDPRLNRLFSNTLWSQKDNFLDIPTDCPQRDERLG
jgi:alpha-L-rhamnosidase